MTKLPEVKKATKAILKVRKDANFLDKFCFEDLRDKQQAGFYLGTYYIGYTVIGESKIEIRYGYGDMESTYILNI